MAGYTTQYNTINQFQDLHFYSHTKWQLSAVPLYYLYKSISYPYKLGWEKCHMIGWLFTIHKKLQFICTFNCLSSSYHRHSWDHVDHSLLQEFTFSSQDHKIPTHWLSPHVCRHKNLVLSVGVSLSAHLAFHEICTWLRKLQCDCNDTKYQRYGDLMTARLYPNLFLFFCFLPIVWYYSSHLG